jgi:phosphoglycolate phosphatase
VSELARLPEPQALLFDLDGTLVDTVATRIEAWLATFSELGLEAEESQVAKLIGADGKRLAREVAAAGGRQLTTQEAERIDQRSGEIYDQLNTDPRSLPGARSLLVALTESELPWAIATSSRREQVATSVRALRLASPPTIIDGTHVEHAKPAPDLLLLAAEELETKPAACWYVGDSTWDMEAARAANMVAVGVAYGTPSPRELIDAGAHSVTTFRSLSMELRRRSAIDGRGS